MIPQRIVQLLRNLAADGHPMAMAYLREYEQTDDIGKERIIDEIERFARAFYNYPYVPRMEYKNER